MHPAEKRRRDSHAIHRQECAVGSRKHEAFFTTNRDGGKDPVGEDAALNFKWDEHQYRLVSVWESDGEGWDLAGQ